MALVICKECGGKVSSKAEACPHCGAKRPKKTSVLTWIVGGIFAFAIGGAVINGQRQAEPLPAARAPAASTTRVAPTQADLEINAAIAAAKTIKAATKNPASFKLDTFMIYPGGATCYEYRGTNSFNAVVPARAVFVPSKPMILTSDRDGNKFIKAWNDTCTKPGGQERAKGISALTDL